MKHKVANVIVAVVVLMALGIAKDRVGTVRYGEEKPVCREANEERWSKSWRDDFIVK